MHASPVILQAEGLCFARPGPVSILQDCDLHLHEGGRLGLAGPVGCGKTTLLRLLVGLETPSAGRVLFQGRPVDSPGAWRELRLSVGMLLQHPDDQLFCPSVLEDVAYGPRNQGLSRAKALDAAMFTLESLGLAHLAERSPARLSGGQKRLAALAGLLVMQPRALLLDEPTTGLDPASKKAVIELLYGLPTALLTVSHEPEALQALCTDICTIEDGRLRAAPRIVHHAHFLGDMPHEHEH